LNNKERIPIVAATSPHYRDETPFARSEAT
jgi:hypothetical protein